jgi:hypothetical protein
MGKKVKITRIVDVTEMGRAGGRARAENLSEAELSAAGSKAIKARWDAYYAANPEKLKAKLEREKRARRAKDK